MSAARTVKLAAWKAFRGVGAFHLVQQSRWRRGRLLILCYHGVSLHDEHEWDADLFLSAERLERRCEALRRRGVQVLPLGEAVRALRAGELVEPAAALTFDDGFYDFAARAAPILSAYGFPATVYLTTYYVDFPRPLFNLAVPYLFWRRRETRPGWREEARRIVDDAERQGLSAEAKDELARRTAESIGLDYDAFTASRALQLLRPDEVGALAAQGFDIQLHTHRHRTPEDEALFRREIRDNRERIERWAGRAARHFCYPSGVHAGAFLPWLRAEGVETATTCDPALASAANDPLLLPRKIDTMSVSDVEFDAWLSGFEPRLRRLT
ncbi:MAG: polysaccharide deacetylase family protein [Acidobacteria bacterium]|nr:polysaccharide deacetylase family protein [Acidobacteriota bacterium]